ncbi:U2 small nuclear ribonucleoprotein auxiliary factor 35 kDa subunit-related protein 2 [Lampris incognitus]|uniref:U2 small nuclear ribonucleoprotein auxiliary factor 35 kDa subunit-related protein 2 n=1 Tax=Lampris incognitus TaxID=2546036 RepID=UPI0024B4E618|nr:U2 small nuclear ribonucleoprotein auxiliary factor 35 kDa subunit-related protein 2 [Lampris incognitus]
MATSVPSLVPAPALSQRVRRAALKKERRKRKRQALAQARECGVKNGGTTTEEEENDENAEKESQQLHEEWLERERVAQEEFKLKHEREEAARKRKEEEEHKIKAEWEAQQKREQDEQDKKQQEKRDREEAVQKMLDQAESQLDNGGPWMNPEAPVTENSANYGTERDIANCPFFLKTGSCRFGERCSRKHVYPTTSPTLLIRGMFVTFGMEQCRRDDYDTDACLEHSEEELQDYFLEFYHDVLPEFRSVGKVVQFKVSCNFEPHLRGNVYVQFDTEDQCREAFLKFNGRWYAGRQLHCQLCPVTRWKNAICGLFDRKKCPKGKNCNFLHVFRNPGNEFWEADRDLHISPDRSGESTHKMGRYSERYGERSWRQRHSSRSPPRSERSHSRRGGEKRRSRSRSRERSRDTRASHCQREDSIQSERRSSRYRPTSSRKDRYRSKSRDRGRNRDRSRSGSRDGERDRLWNESRDEDRGQNKHKGRSRERDRSRSRSGDRERKKQIREKGSTQSPKKPDWRDETGDVNTHTHRQHKRSKKSKKKSKKKHKKKTGHFPEVVTSSGDSEKEEEIEEKKEKEHFPVTSPSKKVNEVDLVWRAGDHMDLNSDSQNDENKSTPEIKSNKSHLEIPADLTGNGDSCTH